MSKKIMFSDRYGLTEAVLQGRKTMTRRVISNHFPTEGVEYIGKDKRGDFLFKIGDNYIPEKIIPPYKVGEVVAIAQSYRDAGYTQEWVVRNINPNAKPTDPFEKIYPGWTNKMFVKAEFMPNFIRFTDLKVERLQDISDEDCLKEGVQQWTDFTYYVYGTDEDFIEPREAFAHLMDKVSGRGTWDSNPYVYAYTFELVK